MSARDSVRHAPDGLPPLRDVIQTYGLNARKSLGQNFILDLNLTAKISQVCGALEGKTVVEIGPGPGGLTRSLLACGAERVIAIERDERCKRVLKEIQGRWPGRLHVQMADALKIDWRALLKSLGAGHVSAAPDADNLYVRHSMPNADAQPCVDISSGDVDRNKVLVIANLPYGIATRLLIGWLETDPWPPWYSGMGLMFQKEVADRIVAQPGNKAYGRLSVISQWCCQTKIALTLPPAAFTPPPKVASAVVCFVPRTERLPRCRVEDLGTVTSAAFGQRRKMLRSSLKRITPFPELLLERAGIASNLRAEEVDVAGFARLAGVWDARPLPHT